MSVEFYRISKSACTSICDVYMFMSEYTHTHTRAYGCKREITRSQTLLKFLFNELMIFSCTMWVKRIRSVRKLTNQLQFFRSQLVLRMPFTGENSEIYTIWTTNRMWLFVSGILCSNDLVKYEKLN